MFPVAIFGRSMVGWNSIYTSLLIASTGRKTNSLNPQSPQKQPVNKFNPSAGNIISAYQLLFCMKSARWMMKFQTFSRTPKKNSLQLGACLLGVETSVFLVDGLFLAPNAFEPGTTCHSTMPVPIRCILIFLLTWKQRRTQDLFCSLCSRSFVVNFREGTSVAPTSYKWGYKSPIM